MNIHEYQGKQVLSKYGVPVPRGKVAETVDEAVAIAKELGTEICMVKAQIHAGGRGKGGGVKVSKGIDAVRDNAKAIIGMQLITKQTGAKGKKVNKVLIEEGMDIKTELYCSVLVDRATQQIVIVASTEGGMNIEEVAEATPEKILKIFINPTLGIRPYQASQLAYGLKLNEINPKLPRLAAGFFISLYNAFVGEDCSLVEINPLVVLANDTMVALDSKVTFDNNAMFRHKGNKELRDITEEDPSEVEASKFDLNYIKLDGSIGCMVNGAGLAMGTMDIIKDYGGDPANFLDVGGAASQENVAKAFTIISSDKNVKCIFVNIFGGIVQCDMVAAGVVAAFKQVDLQIPVVVRLEGTNAKEAHVIIKNSGLGEKLQLIDGIAPAAKMAVKMAK